MSDIDAEEADRRAGAALGRGNLLAAFDIAQTALAAGNRSPGLEHKRLLALARMGDTRRTLAEVDVMGIADRGDEDGAALRARLLKDLAMALPPQERGAAMIEARDAYARAHALDRGYYSAINAATLGWLSGDVEDARRFAEIVLADSRVATARDYYAAATAAEAYLVLGRDEEAAEALDLALAFPSDAAMRASTLRQFILLADASAEPGAARRLTDRLRAPPVLYYAGNLFRHDRAAEMRMRRDIDAALDSLGTTIAYGALAAGADIVIAEAILARGVELHVVLPFARDDFVAISVEAFGAEWRPRFQRCIEQATSICHASDAGYAGDPGQFVYGNAFAMGLACLRASHLCAEAVHLAVWDGAAAIGEGGTAQTAAHWQSTGRRTVIVETGEIDRSRSRPAEAPSAFDGRYAIVRESRALIFTDYAGFSRLDELSLPIFWQEIMGRVGTVLDGMSASVLFRNTWGDALYAVLADPASAAEIALRLQEAIGSLDLVAVGLPAGGGMRIALHYGPLYCADDPVTGGIAYFGTEVTQTARIEPVTPIGQVYATQSYAAFLALTADRRFATSYVGTVPLAKGFGTLAMHRLIRDCPQ